MNQQQIDMLAIQIANVAVTTCIAQPQDAARIAIANMVKSLLRAHNEEDMQLRLKANCHLDALHDIADMLELPSQKDENGYLCRYAPRTGNGMRYSGEVLAEIVDILNEELTR